MMVKVYQNHGTATTEEATISQDSGLFGLLKIQNLGSKTLLLNFTGNDDWWNIPKDTDPQNFKLPRLSSFKVKTESGETTYQIYATIL